MENIVQVAVGVAIGNAITASIAWAAIRELRGGITDGWTYFAILMPLLFMLSAVIGYSS